MRKTIVVIPEDAAEVSITSLPRSKRTSKSIEGAAVRGRQRGRNDDGHGVCCWRFARLEAGGGNEAEEDHTPCAARIYIVYARFFLSVSVAPPSGTSGVLSVLSSCSFLSGSTAPLLSIVPPDFSFHVRPNSDCSTWLRPSRQRPNLSGRADRSCRFPSSGDRPRSYLSRVFSATGIAG